MDAHAIADGTLGHRAKLRLAESGDYEDLLLLVNWIGPAGKRVCRSARSRCDRFDRALEDELGT